MEDVCPALGGTVMNAVVLVAAVASVSVLLAFLAFLCFCSFVIIRTGGTAGLRDVAVAIRAFRGVLSLRTARDK